MAYGGATPATATYLQNAVDTSSQTTYTFTSQNFGTAASNRFLIVAFASRHNSGSSGVTVTGVTIGGLTATQIVAGSNSQGNNCEIWGVVVPTGTSGTVAITFSSAKNGIGMALYSCVVNSTTPVQTATSTTTPSPTGNVNVPANGFAIGVGFRDSNTTATWSGIDLDDNMANGSNRSTSVAHKNFTSAQTPLAVTCNWGGSNTGNFATASFG